MRSAAALALIVMALPACSRVTGLPAVPESVSLKDAGLDGLGAASETAKRLLRPLAEGAPAGDAVDRARLAAGRIERGEAAEGLADLAAAVEASPADLVLGNAFRMQVYRLKLDFLEGARSRGERSPAFPAYLAREPLATLKRSAAASSARELRVQIAMAAVDEMVLSPALEVKAPASMDSIHAFTAILASAPYYVPALVGRGLNHLNRPRNLVWPEHPAPPADAASRDLGLAAAVGAKVGGASPRVKGILLLLLGDAYAHEGNAGVARSWWTLAGESTDDRGVHKELEERARWPEPEIPDRLEARLEERMEDTLHPLSDLSFLWNDEARGPW